jgi:alginate O-acetyltransferase complex protein AlgI
MLFNSLEFLIFLPVVLCLYFLCPRRYNWILLLVACYYFYACWKLEYVFLLGFVTLVDYLVAIRIGNTENKHHRNIYLWIGAVTNLGMLFLFKYFNFFNETARAIFNAFNIFYNVPTFQLLLPVGISFYTFQALGYMIDVYKQKRPPERHLGIFALYVSFFPQLLSGPIERAHRLLPQFYARPPFDWGSFKNGFALMLWGYFQKVVIADRLAIYVNHVYSQPAAHKGLSLILAALLFPFQLYSDFAGYTHIAMGVALMMNYKLMNNFNRPFAARTMRDFIFRWHISLTRWIMDYVFYPLAKKATTKWRGYLVTIFVFSLVGLWHGASWNFVLFGLSAGILLVCSDIKRPYFEKINAKLFPPESIWLKKIHAVLQIFSVFLLVALIAIFFRANTFSDIYVILTGMIQDVEFSISAITMPNFSIYEFIIALVAISFMQIIEWYDSKRNLLSGFHEKPGWVQYAFCYTFIFAILMFGEFHLLPFIYFQF